MVVIMIIMLMIIIIIVIKCVIITIGLSFLGCILYIYIIFYNNNNSNNNKTIYNIISTVLILDVLEISSLGDEKGGVPSLRNMDNNFKKTINILFASLIWWFLLIIWIKIIKLTAWVNHCQSLEFGACPAQAQDVLKPSGEGLGLNFWFLYNQDDLGAFSQHEQKHGFSTQNIEKNRSIVFLCVFS